MKKILTITIGLIFLVVEIIFAQCPDWLWAKKGGGNYLNKDHNNNIYAIQSLINLSTTSIQFSKFNSNGDSILFKEILTQANIGATFIVPSLNSGFYLAGAFYSPPFIIGQDSLNNTGLFLTRCDSTGNFLWSREVSAGSANPYDIISDDGGNVRITGICVPGTTFGSFTIVNGGPFMVIYDSNGTVLFAAEISFQMNNSTVTQMRFDQFMNIFISGYISSTGFVEVATDSVGQGVFLLKVDDALSPRWVRGGLSTNLISTDYFPTDIATNINGEVVFAGNFGSTDLIFESDTLSNPLMSDIFVAKYDSTGHLLMTKKIGEPLDEYNPHVALEDSGNVYLGGIFLSLQLDFGTGLLINHSSNMSDCFLVKFDTAGIALWGKVLGGINNDNVDRILLLYDGKLIVSGMSNSPVVDFITGSGVITLNSSGYFEFIAALSKDFPTTINENIKNVSINVFPNPSNEKINISMNEIEKNTELKLFSSTGKLILSKKLENIFNTIDCSGLASGLYYVTMNSMYGRVTRKVVIQ